MSAYDPKKLSEIVQPIGGSFRIWVYDSENIAATVIAANYISDAQDKGMKVNDLLIIKDTTTPLIKLARISAVASTGATALLDVAIS